MERRQDLLLGCVFAALGLLAAWQASGYRGASGGCPLALALGGVALGASIALRAGLRGSTAERRIVDSPRQFLITLVAGAGYLALVSRLGFYTASALLAIALPTALGLRRPLYLVVVTAAFIALVWAIFSLVLEKPLPRELLWRLGG